MSLRCKIGRHDWRQISIWRHWVTIHNLRCAMEFDEEGDLGSECDIRCARCGKTSVLGQAWDCGVIQLWPEKIPNNIGGKPFRIIMAV